MDIKKNVTFDDLKVNPLDDVQIYPAETSIIE
jgi:hypothetical protein